jgi:hypothetical protein
MIFAGCMTAVSFLGLLIIVLRTIGMGVSATEYRASVLERWAIILLFTALTFYFSRPFHF